MVCFVLWIVRLLDEIYKFSNNNSSKNKIIEYFNNYFLKFFKWFLFFELVVFLDEGKIDEVLYEIDGNWKMCS